VPPFAVCSNARCPVYVDLHEEREGRTRVPPETCPACESPLLWHCHACHWPLFEMPNRRELRCCHCGRNLLFTQDTSSHSSNGDAKMPYALCSNSQCEYSIKLHDRPNGLSVETPLSCPRCKRPMISICPECGFLLMGTTGATVCAVCRADIRQGFIKWRTRAQSA